LTYHRTIDGDDYSEEKRITLRMGSRMYAVESTFTKNGEVAENLPVAIGVTTHDGKAKVVFDKDAGWLSAWEEIDGFGLGTGIFMDPKAIVQVVPAYDEGVPDTSHALFIAHTDSRGKVFYHAGYGWEKANGIRSAADWQAYLKQFAAETMAAKAVPKQ
jgi:hypothetical protein